MKKKQLAILSFDSPSSPLFSLDFSQIPKNSKFIYAGYDVNGRSVIKTTLHLNKAEDRSLLTDPSEHNVLPLNQGKSLKWYGLDKQIPHYVVSNLDWIFVLTLSEPKKPPDTNLFPLFQTKISKPVTPRRYYIYWLLEQLSLYRANSLMEMSWTHIYDLFSRINTENPCTIFCCDGQDVVVYQGVQFDQGISYLRSCPPHHHHPLFKSLAMQFQLDGLDVNHTMSLISTQPIAHEDAFFLHDNQMMVVRTGERIWNKDPQAFISQVEKVGGLEPASFVPKKTLHEINLLVLPTKGKTSLQKPTIITESADLKPAIYAVSHESVYEYETPVYLSTHLLRLQPLTDLSQSLIKYELKVKADGKAVAGIPANYVGSFGNNATFIEIKQPYTRLELSCKSIVAITRPQPRRIDLLHLQRTIPLIWMPWDKIMMQAYLIPTELPESDLRELSNYALTFVKRNNYDLFEVLNDINRTIFQDYTYLSGSTTLSTTAYDVYTSHRGVCQDFANLFICLARLLNIPARYRTGYIYTGKKYTRQEQGDASHAWLEVFLPLVGWYGYDPTNNCIAEKDHIRVACGRSYSDTSLTSGTIYRGGGGEKLDVDVRVVLLNEIDEKQLRFKTKD